MTGHINNNKGKYIGGGVSLVAVWGILQLFGLSFGNVADIPKTQKAVTEHHDRLTTLEAKEMDKVDLLLAMKELSGSVDSLRLVMKEVYTLQGTVIEDISEIKDDIKDLERR